MTAILQFYNIEKDVSRNMISDLFYTMCFNYSHAQVQNQKQRKLYQIKLMCLFFNNKNDHSIHCFKKLLWFYVENIIINETKTWNSFEQFFTS